MNKRDFIVQGGSTLLCTTTLGSTWAATPTASASTAANAQATTQAAWKVLEGQAFTGQTTLGRAVTLTLNEVSGRRPDATAIGMEQFTVSFHGPRALPLKSGMHQLTHPEAGAVQLYLEAVHQGEHIHYDAHFSLLS